MATVQDIQDTIARAQGYYIELLDADTALMEAGNKGISENKLRCIKRLCKALQWDLDIEVNDDTTTDIYELLLNAIFLYNGDAITFDPDVYIPGRTVIVESGSVIFIRSQANLIEDGAGTDNWYLPFLDDEGNQPDLALEPVSVITTGQSFTFRFNENFAPRRIYGFANNDPQTIKVKVI